MRRPRLLVLASTYPGRPDDGTPAFVRDLALQEAEAFDTVVVVPRVPGGAAVETDGPLRVRRYPYYFRRSEDLAHGAIIENLRHRRSRWLQVVPFFLAQAITTVRTVRSFKPDIVHVHWIIPQGIVSLLVPRRIPVLLTTLGGDLYALDAPPLRRLKSLVVRRASRVTVMNLDMARRVVALGADDRAVEAIPMGADLSTVPERVTRGSGAPLRLLFVGRLVEKKGLSHLIDAISSVDHSHLSLRVVGDGPLGDELRRRAAGLPIEFVGQAGRSALFDEYARADVVIFPSVTARSGDRDGLPVALLEAMGSGCAIIGSRIAGIDEAVVDGESGVLVPSGDTGAIARAIQALAGDADEVERLGAGALARSRDFSTGAIGRRYRDILRTILEEERPRQR